MGPSIVQTKIEDVGSSSKGNEQCWESEEKAAGICKEYWGLLWQTAIVVMLLYMLVKKNIIISWEQLNANWFPQLRALTWSYLSWNINCTFHRLWLWVHRLSHTNCQYRGIVSWLSRILWKDQGNCTEFQFIAAWHHPLSLWERRVLS